VARSTFFPYAKQPVRTESASAGILVARGAWRVWLRQFWLLGILSAAHIAAGWRNRQRRWTGTVMLAVIACLLVSGYLLYYLRDDRLIAATALLHWSGGLAAPLAFLLHRFAQTARKKRRHATSAG
jgi:hypothetical protein